MISQVISGDRTYRNRTIEDIDETVLNAAQMKAIAAKLTIAQETLKRDRQELSMRFRTQFFIRKYRVPTWLACGNSGYTTELLSIPLRNSI